MGRQYCAPLDYTNGRWPEKDILCISFGEEKQGMLVHLNTAALPRIMPVMNKLMAARLAHSIREHVRESYIRQDTLGAAISRLKAVWQLRTEVCLAHV